MVLSDNMNVTWKRLNNLVKKLEKNPNILEEHDQAIRQYHLHGVAEELPAERESEAPPHVYCMPHQAVLREGSSSTRLGVVFNASSHAANAKSLNDNLDGGPNPDPDVTALLRFRKHPVVIVAVSKKRFCQSAFP